MEWTKKRKKPTADEEAELNDALLEFQADFGQTSAVASGPKTFVRGDVVEGNKKIADTSGSLYVPKVSINLSKTSNVGSKDFDEARKLAAAKARRMLEDAARTKNLNVVPKVVVPSSKPLSRPPKPGSLKAKQDKPKMSNLEMFKQELQRVQEDREKRKDLRDQLEKVGMDVSVVNRLAPKLNTPFTGFCSGDFDNDPYTTNLYVSNVPHNVTEEDLLFTFGSFGPLAALKILYPRNEEERRRPHICAFVAYMSRDDLDRFTSEVKLMIIRDEPIRFSYARPVVIPPTPYYIPPQLLQLQCPDPLSGLPFNAQPVKKDADEFLKKYKTFPPINMLPNKDHPAFEDYMNLIRNAVIRVVIPPDRATLRLINRTAIFVVTEGSHFEAMICSREFQNPAFQFLWDNTSACHVYYRWRIYSLLQGDSPHEWRREKFRMFENGSWWIPPFSTAELNKSMPKCLHESNCVKTHPERWLKVKNGREVTPERGGGGSGSRRREAAERMEKQLQAEEEARKAARKERMSSKKRDKLEKMLRELTPEQLSVGETMVWCVENAVHSKEICECIFESLTFDETPLHKKIARVYLINDILANCVQRSVRDVSYYRSHFENLLEKIFATLGKTYKNIASRIKQEQFKQRIMNVFRHWEETALYPVDRLIHNQNIFLGLVEISPERKSANEPKAEEEEEEEDLDGMPIDESIIPTSSSAINVDDYDENIDGIPLDNVPEIDVKPTFSRNFKPVLQQASPRKTSPLFASKWDDLNLARKSAEEDEDDIDGIAIGEPENRSGSLSPGEIKDDSKSSSSSHHDDEKRRKLIRDVEVRAMTMLDDLEADRDPRAKQKVDAFRKAEMEKVEKLLKEETEKRKDRRSSRKERRRSRSRTRSRSRSRDRRDRDRRDRERKRDRSSDRNRDRDRRHRN
ncbi:unnamed protein product [Caenorhabditis bovis]|uniref:Uncharacterized protein n=1 Tax=Caenorhabditis bovis TaxID=2654633 RepID=A0A8S1EMJ8_9PELO|nr:unnamed protein product [Caenorhabditis bovis]